MKKLLLSFAIILNAFAAFAQCDDPRIWYHTSTAGLHTRNLATGATDPICSSQLGAGTRPFHDIAFAPNGYLYGVAAESGSTGYLYRIDYSTNDCLNPVELTNTGSLTFNNKIPNSLTFLPDGTALVGFSSSSTTVTDIYRIRISGNTYTMELWHMIVPVYSGNPSDAGGDFVLLGNKLYASMKGSGYNMLYEITVDENYNYVSTVRIYIFSLETFGRMQGMAAINGELYGGFDQGYLGKINFAGEYFTVTIVPVGTTTNISGMTAMGESKQNAIPYITASGSTICSSSTVTLTSNKTGSYRWYKDGVAIPGTLGAGRTYVANSVGSYTVQVTSASGCKVMSAPHTITAQCNVVNGTVWVDLDHDAILDASEAGSNLETTPINGLWANLIRAGNVVQSVYILPNGKYRLSTSKTGTHQIQISNKELVEGSAVPTAGDAAFVLPQNYIYTGTNVAGTANTGQIQGRTGDVNITVNTAINNVNFGVGTAKYSITGTVFNDNDGTTGGANAGESGSALADVQVSLYQANGSTLITNVNTNGSGIYTFPAQIPADYVVKVTLPATPAGETAYQHVSSTDATPTDGSTTVTVNGAAANGVNFGLNQSPTAVATNPDSQTNPGTTMSKSITDAFSGTDPGNGVIKTLTIAEFPENAASLTVGDITYYPMMLRAVCPPATTCESFPTTGLVIPTGTDGVPSTAISVDPVDGDVVVKIYFTVSDNALLSSEQISLDVAFSSPLPVTLASFTGKKNDDNSVALTWTTTAETNSEKFEVEHSVSGKNWKAIGTVVAKGESAGLIHYNYTHTTPANGENLYRLKMVDTDATFAYSRILSVGLKGSNKAVVYPNPVSQVIYIKDLDVSKVKEVTLNDLSGRVVYRSVSVSENGLDVQGTASGIYILKIMLKNGETVNRKVVVNK